MTRKQVGVASALIVVGMLGAALAVGASIPADIRLPTHWGLSGDADSYSPKWPALLMPAGLATAVSLFFYFMPSLEPREKGLERSQGLYLWGWAAVLMLGVVIELAVISVALHWGLREYHLIVGGVGVVLVLIGNQLGKSRSMYLIGVRTPWTLASEEVWIKTHRLAGKLMVASGLAMAVAALLPIPSGVLATVLLAGIALSAVVPIIYSFIAWQREKKAGQPSE